MKTSLSTPAKKTANRASHLRCGTKLFIGMVLLATFFLGANTFALAIDKEEKIYISMQGKMQIDSANERAIYSKNVVVSQGSLKIAADQIELYGSVNNPKKIIATGSPARLEQKPSIDQAIIVVTGNQIEYSVDTGKVEIITNAQFEQDGTVIQASKLFYDVSNSYVEADADGNSISVVIPPKKEQRKNKTVNDQQETISE